MPNVPRHLHLVTCFQEGTLESDDPVRQYFSRILTVSSRGRGEKRTKDTRWTRTVNPNSHIPHLHVQLTFAWYNRLVLDRRLCAVSWNSRCSKPTLQRRYEGVQRQSPTRSDNIFRLVALIDTRRLYGIQSPDPVALTSFSCIIRPLSIMFYAAKGHMAIKVMVL